MTSNAGIVSSTTELKNRCFLLFPVAALVVGFSFGCGGSQTEAEEAAALETLNAEHRLALLQAREAETKREARIAAENAKEAELVKLAAEEEKKREEEKRATAERKAATYQKTIDQCRQVLGLEPCDANALSLDEQQREACKVNCQTAVTKEREDLLADALSRCKDAYIESKGTKQPACSVAYNDLSADNPELQRVVTDCNVTCKKEAPGALTEVRRTAQEEAQAEQKAEQASRAACRSACADSLRTCKSNCAGLPGDLLSGCHQDCALINREFCMKECK